MGTFLLTMLFCYLLGNRIIRSEKRAADEKRVLQRKHPLVYIGSSSVSSSASSRRSGQAEYEPDRPRWTRRLLN